MWVREAKTIPSSLIPALELTSYVNFREPLHLALAQAFSSRKGNQFLSLPACQAGGSLGGKQGGENTFGKHPAPAKYKMLLL